MCDACYESGDKMLVPFPESGLELFLKTLNYIRLHPAEFYMPSYILSLAIIAEYAKDITIKNVESVTGLPMPHCGTVACLAGHIYLTAQDSDWKPESQDAIDGSIVESGALKALGIPEDDWVMRGRLQDVFGMVTLRTYAELKDVLERRFTFGEFTLPEPATKAELKRVRDREYAARKRAEKKLAKMAAAKKEEK